METVNTRVLVDPDVFPDEGVLRPILGRSFKAYENLLELFEKHGLLPEWRYYRDGKAWLCKVQKKKRTIVWMSAWEGYMQASVYVPTRNIADLPALGLGAAVMEKLRSTKDVGKSRPVIFELRNGKMLPDLAKVIAYKESLK